MYTGLSGLGVFTFCTCCILICLMCFVLLTCLLGKCFWLTVCIVVVDLSVLLSRVFVVLCVYCFFTLNP